MASLVRPPALLLSSTRTLVQYLLNTLYICIYECAVYRGLLQFVPLSRRGEKPDDDGRDPCQKASKRKQTTRNSRAALLEHVVPMHHESRLIRANVPTRRRGNRTRYSRYDFREDRGKNRGTCFHHFNVTFRCRKFHAEEITLTFLESNVNPEIRRKRAFICHERSEIFL